MGDNNLYKKIENYVTALFQNIRDPTLIFHDFQHTQNVVKHTLII